LKRSLTACIHTSIQIGIHFVNKLVDFLYTNIWDTVDKTVDYMYTGISKQIVYRLVNMATKVISTRIDEVLIERFDEKVAAANITRNELIAKLISDFLGSDGIVDSTVDKSIQVAVDKAVDKGIQDAIAAIEKQSPAPDVDIQAMIDDALRSKILELREEFEEHERIYQAQCQKGFELQVATFRDEMNEAIATAKKPLLSVMRDRVIAA